MELAELDTTEDARAIPYYDTINFGKCDCVAYGYNGVPVAPVEFLEGTYRCLMCGETWDEQWLHDRRRSIRRRRAYI